MGVDPPGLPKTSSTNIPRLKTAEIPVAKPTPAPAAPAPKPAGWKAPVSTAKAASDGFETKRTLSRTDQPVVAAPQARAQALSPADQQTVDKFLGDVKTRMKALNFAPEVQTAVLERLSRLSGPELLQETKRLAPLVASGGQPERALATDLDLDAAAKADPALKERLTPSVREALVRGVADPRSEDASAGASGVIGRKQALEAAKTLAAMDPASAKEVMQLLDKAGRTKDGKPTSGRLAERALILKAVAARADAFKTPEGAKAALKELGAYANDIRGLPQSVLARTSTVTDVDNVNTSKYDPSSPGVKDEEANNDGLYQRYEESCGPTVAQMMRAEADPVYALKLHKQGLNNPSPDTELAREQRASLEKPRFEDGRGNTMTPSAAELAAFEKTGKVPRGMVDARGVAVPRAEQSKRLITLAAQADKAGLVGEQRRAIEADLEGKPPASPAEAAQREKLWGAIRKANGGKPSAAEVDELKKGARHGFGMKLEDAVNDIARQATHTEVRAHPLDLNQAARLLESGQPVPLYLENDQGGDSHFMLMTDVSGTAPYRNFLVSDPASGKTLWVTEADLNPRSKVPWPKRDFGHPSTQAVKAYW